MRSSLITVAALLMTTFAATREGRGDEAAPLLRVRIGVPERDAVVDRENHSHFHVVIENVSEKPQKVIDEWNSWGYFSLSFEYTTGAGEKRTMEKLSREWTKNFLTTTTLKPGEVIVREVYLDKSVWSTLPVPKTGEAKVKIRAVFAQEDQTADAWHGKVSSPEQEINFRNDREK